MISLLKPNNDFIVEVDKKVNLKKDFEELMVQYENLKSLYEKKSVDVLLLKEKLNKQNSLIDEMKEFIDSVTKVRNIKKRIEKKVFSQ